MIFLTPYRGKEGSCGEVSVMQTFKWALLAFFAFGILFVLGCDDSSSSGAGTGTGTLSLYMTDAVTNDFRAVYVTIADVAVHRAATGADGDGADGRQQGDEGWEVVASPQKTYNLLELVNGAMAELGTTELETGHYTQLRLMLGGEPDEGSNVNGNPHPHPNYVVNEDGTARKLTVPSGYQSGIKLVHGFDMVAGQTAELVLDFDANRSVVATGSGKVLLKPTIKIVDSLNYPLVKGVVRDASGNPLPDALVSAQKVASQDGVEVFTATVTEGGDGEAGAYQMYLPTGAYYIVAYKGGVTDDQGGAAAYGPSCLSVEATRLDAVYDGNDVNLEISSTGDIPVEVILPAPAEEDAAQTASLSVRKNALCAGGDDQIELESMTVGESGTYQFSVPGSRAGTEYSVAGTSNGVTMDKTVTVTAGLAAPPIEFDFTR